MAGPVIRLGDKTTHDGTVVQASTVSDIGGLGIARMGDETMCPRHGSSRIVSGDTTCIVDGQPVARDGDTTACGAILIAGQQATVDLI